MTENKILIISLSTVVIIFLILCTVMFIVANPYEISINMDDNTREAMKSLSEIRTLAPDLIEFPRPTSWIDTRFNGGKGSNSTCYKTEEIQTFQNNLKILYG